MRNVLKNKVLVSIIGILLLANIAMLVFFIIGMKKPDRENHGEQRLPPHATESFLQTKVGFTDQQIEQFNKLKEVHHAKLFPLFEDLRKTKDQFFVMVKDSQPDSYIDSMANVIGEKQRTLDRTVFETIREVRNICTPQQQVGFDSLLPKIAYKMAGHIRKGSPKEEGLKKTNR
ncbi:MAG TPA: hypothetical protein VKA49_11705 [Flavitalea sp.]|nr:hypothetical protein [Flavitalea sp.]